MMDSEDDEPDGALDQVQEAGIDTERDTVLDSSTNEAKVTTPHSSSSNELSQTSPGLGVVVRAVRLPVVALTRLIRFR